MDTKLEELLKEKLNTIDDYNIKADIVRYFCDIHFFNSKIMDYKWLSSITPKIFHNTKICDVISLSGEKLSSLYGINIEYISCLRSYTLVKIMSQYSKYEELIDNNYQSFKCLGENKNYFTNYVLCTMRKSDELYDAGIALYSQDSHIKKYSKTRK